MKHNQQYNHYKELAEKYIFEITSELSSPSKKLLESMKYSLLNGGKRLRPVIFLAAFDICSKDNLAKSFQPHDENAKKNLCFAIEALHTYTLIHDDLPCMDDDSMRRGKPANHIVFGETCALLAGDALLNSAIEHALAAVSDEKHLKSIRYFFKHTGINGVIGGQSIEFEKQEKKISKSGVIDVERDLQIIECKTAALFKAAAVMGGISGSDRTSESAKKSIDLLERFGYNFGMAFQIYDDIKDLDGMGFAQKYGIARADLFLREYALNARLTAKELESELFVFLSDSLCD